MLLGEPEGGLKGVRVRGQDGVVGADGAKGRGDGFDVGLRAHGQLPLVLV